MRNVYLLKQPSRQSVPGLFGPANKQQKMLKGDRTRERD